MPRPHTCAAGARQRGSRKHDRSTGCAPGRRWNPRRPCRSRSTRQDADRAGKTPCRSGKPTPAAPPSGQPEATMRRHDPLQRERSPGEASAPAATQHAQGVTPGSRTARQAAQRRRPAPAKRHASEAHPPTAATSAPTRGATSAVTTGAGGQSGTAARTRPSSRLMRSPACRTASSASSWAIRGSRCSGFRPVSQLMDVLPQGLPPRIVPAEPRQRQDLLALRRLVLYRRAACPGQVARRLVVAIWA